MRMKCKLLTGIHKLMPVGFEMSCTVRTYDGTYVALNVGHN